MTDDEDCVADDDGGEADYDAGEADYDDREADYDHRETDEETVATEEADAAEEEEADAAEEEAGAAEEEAEEEEGEAEMEDEEDEDETESEGLGFRVDAAAPKQREIAGSQMTRERFGLASASSNLPGRSRPKGVPKRLSCGSPAVGRLVKIALSVPVADAFARQAQAFARQAPAVSRQGHAVARQAPAVARQGHAVARQGHAVASGGRRKKGASEKHVPNISLPTEGDKFTAHRGLIRYLLNASKNNQVDEVDPAVRTFASEKCSYCQNFVTPRTAMNCIASAANVPGLTEHNTPMCPCAVAHLVDDDEEWVHTCQICQRKAVLVPAVFLDKYRTKVHQIIPGVVLYNKESNRANVYVKVGEATGEWVEPSTIEKAMKKGTNCKWKSICYVESPCGNKLVRFEAVRSWEPIGAGKVDIACTKVLELAAKGWF